VSADRTIIGIVLAILGVVSANPVGASGIPLDTETTSDPVPDGRTNDEPRCGSEIPPPVTPLLRNDVTVEPVAG
jgi:hypothetical protein